MPAVVSPRGPPPPVIVVMAPRGDVWSGLAAAVAQWFWDQGLRGGAGARWRDASKPLCVVDGAVDDDDLH